MKRLPVSLLYSHDPAWLQRIRGYLWSLSEVVPVADEPALCLLLAQHSQCVLFLDLCGTDAVPFLRECRADYAGVVIIALGDARSDPGLLAMAEGVHDVLDASVDRLRVQCLFRQIQTQLQLQAELRVLREREQQPRVQEPKVPDHAPFSGLHHLSGALRRFDNLALMLESIIDGICQAKRVARVGIVLVQPTGGYRYRTGRNCLEGVRDRVFDAADPLVHWLQVHAHSVSLSTLRHAGPVAERLLLEEGLALHGADLILPLFGRDRLLGWLFMGRPASGVPFQDQDIEALSHLAEQVSIAIENAMLHDSLAVQKALAENLLQTIPSGIIAASPDGKIKWLNNVAGRLLHMQHDGKHRIERLPVFIGDMLRRCMGGKEEVGPLEWVEPISRRALGLQARRLEQNGTCIGAMMILQDLTDEHLLREKQNNIERAAFWNELTTALSHEVRNPLVAISTFAQLLPERYDDEEFRTRFRELTTQEVERLNSIVDQLDLFANPPTLRFVSVDVEALLHAALCKEQNASTTHVQIEMRVPDALPPVRADMDVLSHAISHLLDNARNAVAERTNPSICIEARTGTLGENRQAIVIEIRDNGCGIPAALREKVYSPFCTTKTRGVGLGLAIVRRTMIDHEGLVEIDSSAEGTTVRLILPVASARGHYEILDDH